MKENVILHQGISKKNVIYHMKAILFSFLKQIIDRQILEFCTKLKRCEIFQGNIFNIIKQYKTDLLDLFTSLNKILPSIRNKHFLNSIDLLTQRYLPKGFNFITCERCFFKRYQNKFTTSE